MAEFDLASPLPVPRRSGAAAIEFRVNGIPAPQGSKRHVGNGIMVESSKAVGPWREAVRAECQRAIEAGGTPVMDGPVGLTVRFFLPRPKGHFGTGRNVDRLRPSAPDWPAGKPDADKLLRAVLDALTAGGAWRDDAQVVLIDCGKHYVAGPLGPGARITVRGETR